MKHSAGYKATINLSSGYLCLYLEKKQRAMKIIMKQELGQ